MYRYEVGNYLNGQLQKIPESIRFNYDESGPSLMITLSNMTAKETEILKHGKINFALFEKDSIMFLLINIPGVMDWSDAPFHIGLYKDDRNIPDIPDGGGLGLTILGVEANNSIIKAIRFVGLGTKFSREMVRIMREQKQTVTSQAEHQNKLSKIYREYSCERMLDYANITYKAGMIE